MVKFIDRRIVQGIEYDALGRRRGYWMFPDHPGGAMPVFGRRFESLRIGAEGVAHLFERQRVRTYVTLTERSPLHAVLSPQRDAPLRR